MTSHWPKVRLAELLRPASRPERVDPAKEYALLGVRLDGRGPFHRETVLGSTTSATVLSRVQAGDFIYSRLFAWRGAFGVVGHELDGHYVSGEFPTFLPADDRLDLDFLRLWFRLPSVLAQVTARSSGSTPTTRNRLREDQFLSLEILVPPLDEQRRIVTRLDSTEAHVGRAQGIAQGAERELQALQRSIATSLPRGSSNSRVGDYVSIQSGYAFERSTFSEEGIRLVRNVNIGHGGIDWRQTARLPEGRRAEFERFELADGDILVSLDRPIISTGVKVAQVRTQDLPSLLVQRVGRVRIRSTALDPDFFFAWLQSPMFIDAIDPGRSNGIPHISTKDVEGIPFSPPPITEQRRAFERMGVLRGQLSQARRLHAELLDELGAVLPALLSREFRGPDLAVPGS